MLLKIFNSQPYFCGGSQICFNQNLTKSLDKAIHNIDSHFSVVGILEQYENSLGLLEQKVPALNGICDFYKNLTNTGESEPAELGFQLSSNEMLMILQCIYKTLGLVKNYRVYCPMVFQSITCKLYVFGILPKLTKPIIVA